MNASSPQAVASIDLVGRPGSDQFSCSSEGSIGEAVGRVRVRVRVKQGDTSMEAGRKTQDVRTYLVGILTKETFILNRLAGERALRGVWNKRKLNTIHPRVSTIRPGQYAFILKITAFRRHHSGTCTLVNILLLTGPHIAVAHRAYRCP